MSESQGISIQSMCYQCQALTELCPECQEQRDAQDIVNAHQIVDENLDYLIKTIPGTVLKSVPLYQVANGGTSTERRPLTYLSDQVSGHDWVESVSKLIRPFRQLDGTLVDERYEFLDPISLLADRIYDLETSTTITTAETICEDCHLVYNKAIACPNCN